MADQFEMPPPQPTGSLWGNVFGLGPIVKLINDPQLADNAKKAMAAIIASHETIARIENKLDVLLRAQGHDPGTIGRAAALPAGEPDRDRGPTLASVAPDNGAGDATPSDGQAGDAGGGTGGDLHDPRPGRRAAITAAFTPGPGGK
jgi:hypothetical protein